MVNKPKRRKAFEFKTCGVLFGIICVTLMHTFFLSSIYPISIACSIKANIMINKIPYVGSSHSLLNCLSLIHRDEQKSPSYIDVYIIYFKTNRPTKSHLFRSYIRVHFQLVTFVRENMCHKFI